MLALEDATGRPPLLVLLHGRGGGPEGMISDELEDALVAAGDRAPGVLLPDGGEASYWHNRRDGAWARMVVREAIPEAVKRYDADPDPRRPHGRPALPPVAGGHDGAYWRSHMDDYVRFYVDALADC